MPTSSQALILNKNASERQLLRLQQTWARDLAPYSVVGIYNLSGCMPMATEGVKDQQAIRALGRESAQLFKYHTLPRGYTSILSFDQVSHAFRWEAIGGADNLKRKSEEKRITFSASLEENSTPPVEQPKRPISAAARPKSVQKFYVNPLVFDRLVGLGFRSSNFEIDPAIPQRTQSGPSAFTPGNSPRSPTAIRKLPTPADRQEATAELNKYKDLQHDVSEECTQEEIKDEFDDDDRPDVDDELNRIKPSIYMRKDNPSPMPTAGVMSFRDNECFSHADVKYLLETQLGVRIQSIQYDPLNIRVCRDDVRCRWIVNFASRKDLDKAVKNGLVVGKDKIIVYRYDDIARREVSSFKYFMSVQEAKKKLKGTKSWKSVRAVKNVVALRGTKSSKL